LRLNKMPQFLEAGLMERLTDLPECRPTPENIIELSSVVCKLQPLELIQSLLYIAISPQTIQTL